ncbi:MAG TPA: DinB family protein [Bacillota bacterium]|jgi:hypothetical protein
MNAVDFFLRLHAVVHSKRVATAEGGWSALESVLRDATEEELRATPLGMTSIVWALWHIARIEDVAANVIIAGRPQVLDEGGWAERMSVPRRDVGTGMSKDDMRRLSRDVVLPALLEYRDAVGLRTREVATTMATERWEETYGLPESRRVLDSGAIMPGMERMDKFWTGKSMSWFLYWVCAEHSVMHLSRADVVRDLLKSSPPAE